ncbi:MAG: metalloregulator ArsR/SmtB family transcription factor [Coriobacteriia bacterium]|nr:metalloregulator ArsR/SmtB family transcription factor [Coriobacteriia bacterium]
MLQAQLLQRKTTKVFKAFCDDTRLEILELLQSGEKCACVLLAELEVGQSTLSHHMKILVESGIVHARRDGKWTHYSLDQAGSEDATQLLKSLTTIKTAADKKYEEGCC